MDIQQSITNMLGNAIVVIAKRGGVDRTRVGIEFSMPDGYTSIPWTVRVAVTRRRARRDDHAHATGSGATLEDACEAAISDLESWARIDYFPK